jgi:hypothetical protein
MDRIRRIGTSLERIRPESSTCDALYSRRALSSSRVFVTEVDRQDSSRAWNNAAPRRSRLGHPDEDSASMSKCFRKARRRLAAALTMSPAGERVGHESAQRTCRPRPTPRVFLDRAGPARRMPVSRAPAGVNHRAPFRDGPRKPAARRVLPKGEGNARHLPDRVHEWTAAGTHQARIGDFTCGIRYLCVQPAVPPRPVRSSRP